MTKTGLKFAGERPDDIFEAISVIAKRARQINERRAEKFTLKPYQVAEGEEEFEEVPEAIDFDFDSLDKPTTMAMNQYTDGEIEYQYEEPETIFEDMEDGFTESDDNLI